MQGRCSRDWLANQEKVVDEDTFKVELRKFLKKVGISSQMEIEKAVGAAVQAGSLRGSERLVATMTLEIPALDLKHRIDGTIALDKD